MAATHWIALNLSNKCCLMEIPDLAKQAVLVVVQVVVKTFIHLQGKDLQ